jgi:hypothetical protein
MEMMLELTFGYYAALAITLLLLIACFSSNQKHRGAIDISLASVARIPPFKVPERLKYYEADYLNAFKAAASLLPMPHGKTTLSLYIKPTLLWLDVWFAISLACFVALFWCGVREWFPQSPLIGVVSEFCLTMAVAYGIADVAEDLWLAKLLSQAGPISNGGAAVACKLTQLKFLTIFLSVVGGLMFVLLSTIFRAARESLEGTSKNSDLRGIVRV